MSQIQYLVEILREAFSAKSKSGSQKPYHIKKEEQAVAAFKKTSVQPARRSTAPNYGNTQK